MRVEDGALLGRLRGRCLRLEEGGPRLGVLQQPEKDLPEDYNPPARLAVAYQEASRLDGSGPGRSTSSGPS